MAVVTISRTFGAGGTPVGRRLAKRLGAEFVDRSIVAAVAARSGFSEKDVEGYDERLPSVWQRVAAVLASSATELPMPVISTEGPIPGPGMEEQLNAFVRRVIEEAAARGNAVIVGRGAAFVVGRRPGALHVQLHAPLEDRVRHLLSRTEEVPPDVRPDAVTLAELCRSVDAQRHDYIQRLFGVDWLDVSNYDLAIDTGRMSFEAAADVIEAALHAAGILGAPPGSARPAAVTQGPA
jgi:cytidylate kinase